MCNRLHTYIGAIRGVRRSPAPRRTRPETPPPHVGPEPEGGPCAIHSRGAGAVLPMDKG